MPGAWPPVPAKHRHQAHEPANLMCSILGFEQGRFPLRRVAPLTPLPDIIDEIFNGTMDSSIMPHARELRETSPLAISHGQSETTQAMQATVSFKYAPGHSSPSFAFAVWPFLGMRTCGGTAAVKANGTMRVTPNPA